jgi:hypothetical protein
MPILSRAFGGFPQYLHANVAILPQLGHERLLPQRFQFIVNQLSQRFPNFSAPRPNFQTDNLPRPTSLYWTKIKVRSSKKKSIFVFIIEYTFTKTPDLFRI